MTAVVEPIEAQALCEVITSRVSAGQKGILYDYVYRSSHLWLGANGPVIVGFYGLIPPSLLADTAYLWFHHEPGFRQNSLSVIRYTIRMVREWLSIYPTIVGHCVVGSRSTAWVRLLGAEFGEPQGQLVPFEIKAQ